MAASFPVVVAAATPDGSMIRLIDRYGGQTRRGANAVRRRPGAGPGSRATSWSWSTDEPSRSATRRARCGRPPTAWCTTTCATSRSLERRRSTRCASKCSRRAPRRPLSAVVVARMENAREGSALRVADAAAVGGGRPARGRSPAQHVARTRSAGRCGSHLAADFAHLFDVKAGRSEARAPGGARRAPGWASSMHPVGPAATHIELSPPPDHHDADDGALVVAPDGAGAIRGVVSAHDRAVRRRRASGSGVPCDVDPRRSRPGAPPGPLARPGAHAWCPTTLGSRS